MSANPVRLRPATREDVSAALTMKLAAWREVYAGLRDEDFFRRAEARLDDEIAWWQRGIDAGAEFHLAELPGAFGTRIVGLAGATPALPEDADTRVGIEMGVLYVLREHDSASAPGAPGLRAVLLETVLQGRDALVWVVEQDTATVQFYRDHGFTPDGAREELDGDWAGLSEVRMVRRSGS